MALSNCSFFYCFFVNIVVKSKQHTEGDKWSTAKRQKWIPCRGAFTAQLRVWILSLYWLAYSEPCQTSKMVLFAKIFAEIFQNCFFAEYLRVTVLDGYHFTSAHKFTFQKHTSNILLRMMVLRKQQQWNILKQPPDVFCKKWCS